MRLRFAGFPHTSGYSTPTDTWAEGDVREVGEAEGLRLLTDFPGVFVQVEPPRATASNPAAGSPMRRGPPFTGRR